ncbi:hypothetical protein Pgy4_34916, partial [Pseudomonas savastanoi pv. glycinea str. race 4]
CEQQQILDSEHAFIMVTFKFRLFDFFMSGSTRRGGSGSEK